MTTQDFLLSHKRALLAATEQQYNEDPSPSAAANAILISDLELQPMRGEEIRRAPLRAYFGSGDRFLSGSYAEVGFSVEFAASGSMSKKPAWSPLVQACGFTETSLSGRGWKYAPSSDNATSLTIYAYMDKTLHVMTGCRGTLSILLEAQEFPRFLFRFRGAYRRPSKTTFPTNLNTASFIAPEIPSTLSVPVFRLGSQTLGVERFRFDLNNEFPYDVRLNEERTAITGREPEGRLVCRDPGVDTINMFEDVETSRKRSLDIQIGTRAGYRMTLSCPRVQVRPPRYEANEIQTLSVALSFQPHRGDDEISLIVS